MHLLVLTVKLFINARIWILLTPTNFSPLGRIVQQAYVCLVGKLMEVKPDTYKAH